MPQGTSQARNTNLALDAVRTVAAFLVVIGHLQALFFVDYRDSLTSSPLTQLFYLLTSLGHPAVIVFFVLSGFWVGGHVIRTGLLNTFSWRKYLTARLTRLWLVLIPAVILTQALDRFGAFISPTSTIYSGSSDYHTVVPADGPLNTLGVAETIGNVFFLQSLHVPVLGTDTPLWSLAYEFWYYIIFPAAFLMLVRGTALRVRVVCLLVVILGLAIAGWDVGLYFPIWLAGAALAWKSQQLRKLISSSSHVTIRLLRVSSLALLSAASAYGVALGEQSLALDYLVAFFTVIFVSLLLTDISSSRRLIQPISSAADWSYSLYAIHLPILALVASLLVPLSSNRWQLSLLTFGAAVAIAAFVAVLSWLLSLVTEAQTHKVRLLLLGNFPHTRRHSANSHLPMGSPKSDELRSQPTSGHD